MKPLELRAAASATDAVIQERVFGTGVHPSDLTKQTILIILNEEMDDIIKIIKSLVESRSLIKNVSERIKNEAKEQNGEFLDMLDTLGVSVLGKLLTS